MIKKGQPTVDQPKAEKTKSTKSKKNKYFEAIGRRKRAIARVRIFPGKAEAKVNDKTISDYFKNKFLIDLALSSLKLVGMMDKFEVTVKVKGGGVNSQAEAIRHGIARALVKSDSGLKPTLKKAGFLTRDPREKERKKYGFRGARRGRQFRKR